VRTGDLVAELHFVRAEQPPLERGLALKVGMLAQLDEYDGAEPVLGEFGPKQRDRPHYPPVGAQPPKPPGYGRRRERDVRGERIGCSGIVALDEIQELEVERVEHDATAAKLWRVTHQLCTHQAGIFGTVLCT
jgi:hypothetical protein